MLVLEHIEAQPNFPREDLTDSNAQILGLMLGNEQIMLREHRKAEEVHELFALTHSPLVGVGESIYNDPYARPCIDFGITAIEALSALVYANPLTLEAPFLRINVAGLITGNLGNTIKNYVSSSHETFNKEMPKTRQVLLESARGDIRRRPQLVEFGGALARQFSIDCAEDKDI